MERLVLTAEPEDLWLAEVDGESLGVEESPQEIIVHAYGENIPLDVLVELYGSTKMVKRILSRMM